MQDPISARETLEEAIEQLVLERINVHGSHHCEALKTAYENFDNAVERLRATFDAEQAQLFISCENGICHVNGEIMDFYYRAGFADAVAIMNGGKNNAD